MDLYKSVEEMGIEVDFFISNKRKWKDISGICWDTENWNKSKSKTKKLTVQFQLY